MLEKLFKPSQALKFAVIGVLSTLLHLAASSILIHHVFELAFFANLGGYILAVPVSFLGHAKFTYQSEISIALFFKFFINSAWILTLSLLSALLMDFYAVNKYVGTILSILVFPLVSYVVHTYLTFNSK